MGTDLIEHRHGDEVGERSTPSGRRLVKEPRYGDRFVELRKEKFPGGRYPVSALITVANFARPGMEIEIQGFAVIGDRA